MDNLNDSFGKLSTTAREWRPASQQPPPIQPSSSSDWQEESELNAASVKEFVPGRGWISQTNTVAKAATSDPSGAWARSVSVGEFYSTACWLIIVEDSSIPFHARIFFFRLRIGGILWI
jgi:hypothetical protein